MSWLFFLVLSAAQALQNFNTIEDQWQLELSHQGFFTSANYDGDANVVDLNRSHNYKHFLFQLDGSYNVSDEFSLLGSIGAANAQSSDGELQRNSTAGTDIGAGLQYLQRSKWFWIAPEVFISTPFSAIDSATDQVLVSDGAVMLTGQLNILGRLRRTFQIYGSLGYSYLSDGRAARIAYSWAGRVRLKKPWIGLELSGYKSVSGEDQSAATRETVTKRVDAGSLRFYSANPDVAAIAGFLEIPFYYNWVAKIAGGTTVAGVNTAQGVIYQIGLNYSFGGPQETVDYFHTSNDYLRAQRREKLRLKKFRVKHDDEDPVLFEDDLN